MICIEVQVLAFVPIDNGDLTGNFGYEEVWVTISSECESGGEIGPPSSGGGDGSGNGSDDGSGGIGGGSTGDHSNPDDGITNLTNNEDENEIITTRVVPELVSDVQQIDDPCVKLKVLLTNDGLNLSTEIDYLKNKINNPNNKTEHAVSVTRRSNPNGEGFIYRPETRIALGANGGSFDMEGYIIGFVHCHTLKGYSMFSLEDVYALKNIYNFQTSEQRKKSTFLMMVGKNKETGAIETYSIVVDDIEKLTIEIENKLNSPELDNILPFPYTEEEKIKAKLFKLSKLNADEYPNENQEVLETIFLQQFATFGISMYKANPDLTNWIKIELELPENQTSTQLRNTPCN